MAGTLFEKLWESHKVAELPGGTMLLYIDRQLLHEVSSPQAFEGLRQAGRGVHRAAAQLAVTDHAVPTRNRATIADPLARSQVALLERNCADHGIEMLGLSDRRQGIVHVIGPEQGFTLPGITLVCGDSHTATHGAFGALAFGIGSSECETVLATQTLRQAPLRTMRISIEGELPKGVVAKDIIMAIVGRIGTDGATGYAVEYAGSAVSALSMEGRMTLCNMTIEAGSRVGLVSPDEKTFAYLEGRPLAPSGVEWEEAVAYWRSLASDPDARFDRELEIDASSLAPQVTWGTKPDQVASVTDAVPDPSAAPSEQAQRRVFAALDYMGLQPGAPLRDVGIDYAFLGSCTNGRIEDLRAAAAILKGRRVASGVTALAVPGSGLVRAQAEAEGLDRIFQEGGFEWREAGCSLCVAMNDDRLPPGARSISSSNRNFEGRQGPGARTHLASPLTVAASAIAGRIADPRDYL